ncbi:aldose epimerase family protein [Flavobacterium sp.]
MKSFGFLPDGKEVLCYTLTNRNGVEFSVMNYGATITSVRIPVENDSKIDVVLGFDSLEDYIKSYYLPSPPYFGTTVGRFAGRINKAKFILNGKSIHLNKNHGEHSLHGGILGFSRKLWKAMAINLEDNPSISLEYISKENEENFPGELSVRVTYTLTESNELKVCYSAKSSEDTIINLTQHSYFNLDGHQNDVASQKLIVNSDKIVQTNKQLIPTGKLTPLQNHAFDFSSAKNCPLSIDNTFVLNGSEAASLISEKNKLKMSVTTNQPAVHVYVGGNCFGQLRGKENTNYHSTSGICFETQNFPDAPNHSNFPTCILKEGEEYIHSTLFKFENL